jgi:hypothetical protein
MPDIILPDGPEKLRQQIREMAILEMQVAIHQAANMCGRQARSIHRPGLSFYLPPLDPPVATMPDKVYGTSPLKEITHERVPRRRRARLRRAQA